MTNDYQRERQGASRRCGQDSKTPTKRPESISSSFANRHTCERNGVSHRYSYWLDVTGETPAASALPLTGLPEGLASSLPSIEAIEAELSFELDKQENDE